MKKLLLLTAVLLISLLLSNPPLTKHRQAVYEDLAQRFVEDPGAAKLAREMGSDVLATNLTDEVNQKVFTRNYWFFSLTGIAYTETSPQYKRTVGIGIAGNVFLWSGM